MQALLLLLSSRHIFQIVSSSMVAFFIHSQTDHKKIVVNSLDLQLLLHNYFA